MGKTKKQDVSTRKVLNLIGLMIFGGWFLTSIIDANKYSTYTLWEFRLFIIGSGLIYYLVVYLATRKKSNKK